MPLLLRSGRELSLRECTILLRLDGTIGQAVEGWEFDFTKIDLALNFLNIMHPVRLKFKTGFYKRGDHRSSFLHEIRITTYLDIEDANVTLWHELAHCMQAERLYRQQGVPIYDFGRFYNRAMNDTGSTYKNNPYEVEAREIANRYGRMALLV